MHAYLRQDGMYDTYDTEPKVISAAEYEKYVKVENLKARKFELETELSQVESELKTLTTEESSVAAEPTAVAAESAAVTVHETSSRRRW